MRVVAYVRVSGAGQIDAWGLDRQEAAIRQAAERDQYEIVGWERDEGVSGTLDATERPGLRAAMDRIGNDAEGILVADVDRFARALHVQEAALAVVWKRGGHVVTATRGLVDMDDPEDPGRKFLRQVMGAVVELEKGNIVKRMRQGRNAKAATGRKAVGAYAYGEQATGKGRDRDAGPNPAEQEAIDVIMGLRAQNATYRDICELLTLEGYRPKRGGRWHPMTIQRIEERERERRAA